MPTIHLINNTPVIAYQSAGDKTDGYIKIMRLFGGEWVTEGMIDSSPFGDADFDPCWTASDAFSKKHRLGIVFVDKGVFCNDNYQPLLAYFSCNIPPEIKVTSEDDVEELKNGEETVDFGEVLVGTASKPIEFFVLNTGKSGLIIADIEIEGSDFHIREKTMDGSQGKKGGAKEIVAELQPLDNYNFSIVFVPTKPGLIGAVVRLRNNDPDENSFTFTVTGKGFLPPGEF